ncbi:hypothetical protein AMATHDRAFT_164825 [Amanita thiersii Skay4041]|uniref:CCHC-type domain-containing protein n=1 Tax=Amanita thiersii Skay4041 TaxID=703135 RepID=A0A2A9NB30_9AGAR|nr:hypothetical protein AMATHDRAFT_164825 [Amanita thiersii Skay4041]
MVGGAGGGTDEPDWSLNQALAQIQQLMNSLAALQNTVHQQSAIIQQLQNQGPPVASGTVPHGPKMATPPIYDGSMATCEGFINSCRLYMSAKPQEFPTLQIKVTWVLGFMQTGMAQMFRDHFLKYMVTPEFQVQYEQSSEPDQIELLYCNIYKVFGDPNKQAMAIQEVTMIKQGSKSAEEHVQLFKQSYMQSGYGETAGIHEFKRSLNLLLLDKCMAVPELPATLEKWYELVIRLDHQWRQAVAERRTFAAQGSSGTAPVNRPQQMPWRPLAQPAQRDPNTMQVDWNRGPIQCYNCSQTGHMARSCLNPWQQQTHLVSAWNRGMDVDRDELWRMVTGGGNQVGGGGAHINEVPVATPAATATAAQPPVIPYNPQGFQFSQ